MKEKSSLFAKIKQIPRFVGSMTLLVAVPVFALFLVMLAGIIWAFSLKDRDFSKVYQGR